MKCLHVLPMDKLSGAEKLALILCKNIKQYEPVVVCGGDNLNAVFEDNFIKSYSVDFKNKNFFKIIKELKKIIVENNIKIIHAHDNIASIGAYLTKKIYRLDVKVISHIHNCYPWLKGINKTKMIDRFFRKRYDFNIACGQKVLDYYKKNTDYINEINITSLSNAIDVDEILDFDSNDTENIYEQFNIPKDKIILGFIGRISEQKGIIPFINELANHKKKFTNCKFLLVGSGEQEKQVRNLLKELGLDDLFILTGYQDNVYKFYPIIDIFFLPSLFEGLPMVILEAMSFKKPVVSMNVGSISEVIINKQNGLLISKGNYFEFINSLNYLKDNKNISNNYGNQAFNYVEANYDIKKYESEIREIYSNLATY